LEPHHPLINEQPSILISGESDPTVLILLNKNRGGRCSKCDKCQREQMPQVWKETSGASGEEGVVGLGCEVRWQVVQRGRLRGM